MKKFQIAAFASFTFVALLLSSCTPKEGVCDCTGVFSDGRPDSTFKEIRPNGNKDCSFIEGEHFSGSVSWTITCTKEK